jgi:hypothetical protein
MRKTNDEVARKRSNGVTELTQDKFLPGELVLLQHDKDKVARLTKLTMPFTGPYVVLKHVGNDVSCRHLATGVVDRLQVTRLKMFWGTEEAAKKAAEQDADGRVISRIMGWRGDVEKRSTMEFNVRFCDGMEEWLDWADIQETIQFESYCEANNCLRVLLRTAGQHSKDYVKSIMDIPIRELHTGDLLYVDIRCYGWQWFDESLDFLPDRYEKIYVVVYHVSRVFTHMIAAECPTYNEQWPVTKKASGLNAYWIFAWTSRYFDADTMVLVTPEMCREHPILISADVTEQREALAKLFPKAPRK